MAAEINEPSPNLDLTQGTSLAEENAITAFTPSPHTGPMNSMLAIQPPPLTGPMKSTHYNSFRSEANFTAETAPQLHEFTSHDTNNTFPVETNSTAETAPQLNGPVPHHTLSGYPKSVTKK